MGGAVLVLLADEFLQNVELDVTGILRWETAFQLAEAGRLGTVNV